MSAPRLSSRRDAVLREMGLGPIWRLRARKAEADVTEDSAPEDERACVDRDCSGDRDATRRGATHADGTLRRT